MAERFEYDVFLSHSCKDKAVVRELADMLQGDGLRVWLDEWVIQPGDLIGLKLEEGLERSRTLLLFMSKNASESDWVMLERQTALFRDPTNRQRRFIPIRLDDSHIKDSLKQFAYIDWREKADDQYLKLLTLCQPTILGSKEGFAVSDKLQISNESVSGDCVHEPPPLYYFCYISTHKVDQFIAQLSSIQAATKARFEYDKGTETDDSRKSDILKRLAGASYGRLDKRESQSLSRIHLAKKTVSLLGEFAKANRMGVLTDLLRNPHAREFELYYCRARMRVKSFDQQIALLEFYVGAYSIELSCSIRYFSEYFDSSVPFKLTSGNYHFFKGIASPILDAAIIPIDIQDHRIIATPLFLAITSSSDLVI